jgi:hypothetical protein
LAPQLTAKQATVDQIQYLVPLRVLAAAVPLTTGQAAAEDPEAELDILLGRVAVPLLPIKVLPEGQMYPALLLLTIHVAVEAALAALVVLQLEPLQAPVELV